MEHPPLEAGLHADRRRSREALHPAWRNLMRLCESMGYGEIEKLKVHDGLPLLAEVTRQKVKLG